MKLNNRVHFLVLPVLIASFLAITLGLYTLEWRSIHALARSAAEAEATELNSLFSGYSQLANGFLSSFIQSDNLRAYLASDDDQFKALALSGGLDNVFNSLTELSSDHFSIAFIRGSGDREYYYENSFDPFAQLEERQVRWVMEQFTGRRSFATHFYQEAGPRVVFCRILDPLTLKPPANFADPTALAILVAIEPTRFIIRSKALAGEGRDISFWLSDEVLPPLQPLEVRHEVRGFGTLSVRVNAEQVNAELRYTLFILGSGLVVLIALTYLALLSLLRRYVTGPIHHLERQLTGIDLQGNAEFQIHQANDEIGSLSTTFAGLYARLRDAYQITKELAERDALTGLCNRRVFLQSLSLLIEEAGAKNARLALIYIDVDNFKYVNDRFGHTTGDALLKSFAHRLDEELRTQAPKDDRPQPVVSRLAGDEFAVILPGIADMRAAGRIARRILALCAEGFTCADGHFPVGLSIGVALYPEDGDSTSILISNADSAMYQAKKGGRNRVAFFSGKLAKMHRRQQAIERELKQLNLDELQVHCMPIIDADSGKVLAFEMLLRWQSSVLGLLTPDEFLGLAESSGAFYRMDLWMLEQAFRNSSLIRTRFGPEVSLAVNISVAGLSRPDFVASILPLVEQYRVDPSQFCIEINETFCFGNIPEAGKLLQFLHDVGFSLAIEGLGAGYNSLLRLVDFPVRYIKLDRDLVANSIDSGRHRVLRSLIEFCHVQNLKVVAEGVEREEQAQWLRENGCDALQGYLYSRPVRLEELLDPEFRIQGNQPMPDSSSLNP